MPTLSALVVARNEESRLAACLERLRFADELVVVLDRSTDRSAEIAREFGARVIEGGWEREGDRRNLGIAECRSDWIVEVDADEHVSPDLAAEIRRTIELSKADWHQIPVDNYIGARRVRYGWGASFGKGAYAGLFRPKAKIWGPERVHPKLILKGEKGEMLQARLDHYVDRDVTDMIDRLNRYSSARAADLRAAGDPGKLSSNLRRVFSRFFKCYVQRKGYREGGYGLVIALCAGLYPLLSHLKAVLDEPDSSS
jgi:glycosyltransferase involved in cell wall biosynthesis